MSRKRESKVSTTPAKAVSRRQMLEGLGALAAVTACGSTDGDTPGGAAGSGNPGAAGAGSNVAGAPGTAGAPGGGVPGAAGAGGMGSTSTLTSPPWTSVPVQDSSNATSPKPLACNVV